MVAPGQQVNRPRFHDGGDPHCDGAVGDVFFLLKILEGVPSGDIVEANQAGEGVFPGARFVEADMARTSDAQQLNIDAAYGVDLFLISLAIGLDLFHGHGAVGDMDIAGFDVDMVEKVFAHEADVALLRFRHHGVIFIEVEGDHILKAEFLFAMQPDQFFIDLHRGGARCKPQNDHFAVLLLLAHGQGDRLGDMARSVA